MTNTTIKRLGKIRENVYIIYTLLFVLVGLVSFSWLILADKSMLKNTDSFNQIYPFLVCLRRSVKNFVLHGRFDFWSWSIGIGNDTLYNLGFIIFDPFNYVTILFPFDQLELGYSITEFLKLYCAGLVMISFLRYQKHSKSLSLIGGISYAFSSWGLRAIAQTQFLTQMVIFPLIIWGVEKIEKERKSLLFIFSVALSLLTSVYFSYMSGILVVVYLITGYVIHYDGKSFKTFAMYIARYVSRAITSVFLSGIALVPGLLAILQAGKGEEIDYKILPKLKTTLAYIPGFISNYEIFGHYSAVCIGGFFFAMIPAMVVCFKNKKCRLPITMFLICAVFLFFPIINTIFNGMNYAVGRWCYGMVFFYSWAGITTFEHFERSSSNQIKKYLLTTAVLYGITMIDLVLAGIAASVISRGSFYICVITMFFAAITSTLLIVPDSVIRKKVRKNSFVILVAINLSIGIFVYYSPNITTNLQDHRINRLSYRQYGKSLLADFDSAIDDDFYRVEYAEGVTINPERDTTESYNTAANESIYSDVPSVFSYSSFIDPAIFEFDSTVGINNSTRTRNSNNAGRSRLSFLFGTQYYLARDQRKVDNAPYGYESIGLRDDTMVMENSHDVGLGYVFPYVISYSDYMSYSYLEREQILMQAAVVPDDYDGIGEFIDADDIVLNTVTIPYDISSTSGLELNGDTLRVTEKNAYIELSFESACESELYIYLSGFYRIPNTIKMLQEMELGDQISAFDRLSFNLKHLGYEDNSSYVVNISCGSNGCTIKNNYGSAPQATNFDDYLGHFGYYVASPNKIKIKFKNVGTYKLDSIELFAVSQSDFDEQAAKLVDNRFITTEMGSDKVTGFVDSDGGILFLSIINNGGWSVYVDGKKTDIMNDINISFIGVELTPGHHDIELRYECPGFKIGCIMTILGTLGIISLIIYERRKYGHQIQLPE